jgi:hypothetical protein
MCTLGISYPMAASLSRATEVATDKKNSLSENSGQSGQSSQLTNSTKSAANTNESRQKSETVRKNQHNAYQSYKSMLKEAGKKLAENKRLTGNYSASRIDVARHKLTTSATSGQPMTAVTNKNQTHRHSLLTLGATKKPDYWPDVGARKAIFEAAINGK